MLYRNLILTPFRIFAFFSFLPFLVSPCLPSAFADVNWEFAPGRTSVEFNVKHFLLLNVNGKFKRFSGRVVTPDDGDFSKASVEANIPVKSINTGNKDRDAHLVEEVFFHAEKYPEMKFKSTSVTKTGKGKFRMDGMISIRGVTQPIQFLVEHTGDRQLANGKKCCHFKATALLNRYDFGLRWNELTEAGSIAVDEMVEIVMNVALVQSS